MKVRNRKRFPYLMAVLFLLLGTLRTALAGQLQVAAVDTVCGYQSNPISVSAPEAGTLTVKIRDENTLYRSLAFQVPEGKSQIVWDGLGWNEERLARKPYTMISRLDGESGAVYETESTVTAGAAIQAILFALPSDPTVYLQEPHDWFLEFKLLYTDHLVISFFQEETGKMILETSRQVKGGRVNRLSFALLTGKAVLEPGNYRVRVCGQQHPSNAKEFFLQAVNGKRPVQPLHVTGDIMPRRDDSDEEIWRKMMLPATVVDIRNVAHQRVYQEPDTSSRVLGTLHGQSQSLSVLEIREKWARISAWSHEKGAPVTGWVPVKVLKVVQPQPRYGILVDKKAQTLTLFENGKRVDTLLVSTGRMAKNELYQETTAGSFLTDYHMSDYSTNGLKYDFVIRYDGGNLLHQIPYAWSESGKKDMLAGEIYLGCKASHACIRIQEKPSEQGINAYWFWTHLPYHTRVIVLDDPEERTNLEKIVTGNTPDLQDGLNQAWRVETEEGDAGTITMTFGGDVVLGGRESYYGTAEGLPAYLEQYGLSWPFRKLKSLFESDDLTSVNLECVLKDDSAGEDLNKNYRFRGLSSYAGALPEGSVEMVNLANNHTVDYGAEGYSSTQRALRSKAEFFGNGINRVLKIGGHLFGFGACRETTYSQSPGTIAEDIENLKAQGAEFIIYQCHWGTEYDAHHSALQEAMARACQRAGADLVIGHHPHVVQGIDMIDGMPVVYSLGNLMFGGTIRLSTFDGLLVQAIFDPERVKNRVRLRLIPILTSSRAGQKINDYQPVIATGRDALRILTQVQQDTPFLLTEKVTLVY